MRKITRSIGLGFTQPITSPDVNSRSLASLPGSAELVQVQNCGQYSCSLSQRVELSFTLKDDPQVIQNIVKYKEGQK